MPNYDYKCEPCKIEEERRVDYEKRDEQICGECKKAMIRYWASVPHLKRFDKWGRSI